MILEKARSLIIKNGVFYCIGFLIIFGLKLYYSRADADQLGWILAPTAWWVDVLSGIPFERALHEGYINHAHRVIIAPSCSGINFLIISFCTLLFSFVHHLRTGKGKALWTISSLALSYLFTVGVNGLRIILAIYLSGADIYGTWITPERVHRMEGTVVYLLSLFILYKTVDKCMNHIISKPAISSNDNKPVPHLVRIWLPPLFWYFLLTLGIPLLNGAYKNDTMKFTEHSLMIILTCLSVVFIIYLAVIFQRLFRKNI